MSALQDAARCAVLHTPEHLRREREGLLRDLEKLEREQRVLLGAEARARPALSAGIAGLREKISTLSEEEPFAGRFPRLDMTPLSWRDEKGFPRLVLFRTDSPHFRISVRRSAVARFFEDFRGNNAEAAWMTIAGSVVVGGIALVGSLIVCLLIGADRWLFGNGGGIPGWWTTAGIIGVALIPGLLAVNFLARCLIDLIRPPVSIPKFPKKLRKYYMDVVTVLRKCLWRDQLNSVTLGAEFEGLIPEPIREKIRSARKEFRDVFLLAEPGTWSLAKVAVPKRDPLVVGWDGVSLWLIDAFDTTPVEEYVRREFTT